MTDRSSHFSRTRASATRNKRHAPTAKKIVDFLLFYDAEVVKIQDNKAVEREKRKQAFSMNSRTLDSGRTARFEVIITLWEIPFFVT